MRLGYQSGAEVPAQTRDRCAARCVTPWSLTGLGQGHTAPGTCLPRGCSRQRQTSSPESVLRAPPRVWLVQRTTTVGLRAWLRIPALPLTRLCNFGRVSQPSLSPNFHICRRRVVTITPTPPKCSEISMRSSIVRFSRRLTSSQLSINVLVTRTFSSISIVSL